MFREILESLSKEEQEGITDIIKDVVDNFDGDLKSVTKKVNKRLEEEGVLITSKKSNPSVDKQIKQLYKRK